MTHDASVLFVCMFAATVNLPYTVFACKYSENKVMMKIKTVFSVNCQW